MNWKIPLFKIYWEEDDIEAVSKVIKSGTFWSSGPEIEKFEKKIADFVGTKFALAFNSGTTALHTLLLAHDIKDKDVIVPSFTFIATANAVLLAGGTPIFAESESETLALDIDDVKKKITDNTKAIIVVHYAGYPAKYVEELRKMADEKNILLIEDAAEALGSSIKEKKVGTFGHSAIFSFCQNKIITTGEGGMIVTNSKAIYEKAKHLRSHGRVEFEEVNYFSSKKDNDYILEGNNFRISSISAALGISQLNKIEKIIEMRRKNAHYLNQELSKIKGVAVLHELKNHYSVFQFYSILLKDEETKKSLQNYLNDKGIMAKVYFNPVHLKTLYKDKFGYKEYDLPKTENLSKRILTLPLYPNLKKEELENMIQEIKNFFNMKNPPSNREVS